MIFSCKACLSKDAHIASLKAQVEYMKDLVMPKVDVYNPPLINREADAIMSGTSETLDVPASQKDEALKMHEPTEEEIIMERDRILSGTY